MRIAFLTLFLGLAAGRMPVELAVEGAAPGSPAITAVELWLDGKVVSGLTGPPFKGEVDLGPGLLPHHLVARGLDATGVEVARAEQWLNLPQPPATINVEPETGPDGRIAAVRLSFRSITREAPAAVTAILDGAALPVRQQRVVLPAYKPDQPHLLSIEARYATPGLSARRDLAFGGSLAGEVATDLTAVLVRAPGPLPAAPALAGWFTAEGQAIAATAIEEAGPGEILVVRDRSAPFVVRKLGARAIHSEDPFRASMLQFELPLKDGNRVRFVDNSASAYSSEGTTSLLFGISKEFDGGDGGFYARLSRILPLHENGPPHLADAVAIAGLDALAANHRRAVLLLLFDAAGDRSRYAAAAVRRYLATIRVPLYVWSLRPPPYAPAVAAWGEVEDASTLLRMRQAYERLTRDLASQRLVWLDGRHLPQSIALTAAAPEGVELVSGPVR